MSQSPERGVSKSVDSIQQRLATYAYGLNYESLPPEAIHAAKVRIIDSLGALIGGFFGEPCRISRKIAAEMPNPNGATVIGTRTKTTPDMAAFANATTTRYMEFNDSYHWPGSAHGHPSDAVTPVLAAAEHVGANGRAFITGVVLSYEVFCRISDVFQKGSIHTFGFDSTNFTCLASAVAGGKLLGLSSDELSQAISMAVVPNNILRQVRAAQGIDLSMFKAAASGQAGRAGLFAALLARAGMEGPHLPFEGKAGWCEHVAQGRFSLDTLGGNGTPFKILVTRIKPRPSAGGTISSILAAEKIAPLGNIADVKQVIVETYHYAKENVGNGENRWNPNCREDADHSIPYVVAATLMDGTLTPRSFDDSHLWDPKLRALIKKVELVVDEEFTQANNRLPEEHHTRVTVVTNNGERLVGKAGGERDDMALPPSDAQIEQKFRGLTEDVLGTKAVKAILDRLWHLEDMANVGAIPAAFVIA